MTKNWWFKDGFTQLAKVLCGSSPNWKTVLVDSGIGNVPLSNLIEVPDFVNLDELVEILKQNGLKAIKWVFDKSQNDCDILIKL